LGVKRRIHRSHQHGSKKAILQQSAARCQPYDWRNISTLASQESLQKKTPTSGTPTFNVRIHCHHWRMGSQQMTPSRTESTMHWAHTTALGTLCTSEIIAKIARVRANGGRSSLHS
jgi:hypothetical protein